MIALGHSFQMWHFLCERSFATYHNWWCCRVSFFYCDNFICLTYCTNHPIKRKPQNQHTGSISLLCDICLLTLSSFTWFCNILGLSVYRKIWWLTVYSFKQEQTTSIRKFTIIMGMFFFHNQSGDFLFKCSSRGWILQNIGSSGKSSLLCFIQTFGFLAQIVLGFRKSHLFVKHVE